MAARIAAILALGLAGLTFAVAPAAALTRAQANARALKILEPQTKHSHTGVVVYGMPHALRAGTDVMELPLSRARFSPHTKTPTTVAVRGLRAKTWLFWMDTNFGAKFERQTTLLLLEDGGDHVARKRHLHFWPVINGNDAPFVNSPDQRYVVFSSVPPATRPSARRAAPRLDKADVHLPAGSLAGECVITVGPRNEDAFKMDFAAIYDIFIPLRDAGTGLQIFDSNATDHLTNLPSPAVDGEDLSSNIGSLIKSKGCKDVLIYMSGHGVKQGDGPAEMLTGENWKKNGRKNRRGQDLYSSYETFVTAGDIAKILKKFPTTGFKLKIDSCYSGRFDTALPRDQYTNLKFIETSSKYNETSRFYTPSVGYTDGSTTFSTTTNPGNVLVDDPAHPGLLVHSAGVSEFTWGNHEALERFFTSDNLLLNADQQGGNLFIAALTYAAKHEKEADFAATQGLTHPFWESAQEPIPEGSVVTGGSTIDAPASETRNSPEDEDFFELVLSALTNQYCKEHPDAASCKKKTRQAPDPSATVPADGQILAFRVKGTAVPSTANGSPAPSTQIHLQRLRPQPDGSLKVVSTSQAFDLPIGGDPNQITSFAPTNFCVQAGDLLALSTNGGFESTFYPNGVSYQVFGSVAGSQLGYYTKHGGLANGAQFSGTAENGTELLMQWDLGTGDRAGPACRGATP